MQRKAEPRKLHLMALGVGTGAFILYFLTLCPVVSWGDSAKLVMRAAGPTLEVDAGYHILHNYIGWVFSKLPFGTLAFRINLMSAFFGALAAAFFFLGAYRMTTSVQASLAASVALALSHIYWHLSVIAESYTLLFFLISLAAYLLAGYNARPRFASLLGAAFVFGLSINAGLLPLFFIPAIAVFLYMMRRRVRITVGRWFLVAGAVLAGLLPLVIAFIIGLGGSPVPELLGRMLALRFGGDFFFTSPMEAARGVVMFFGMLLYQFPAVGFVAGFAGIAVLWKRDRRMCLLLALSIIAVVLFTSTYMMQRRFPIMSATFLLFAYFIAFGFKAALERWEKSGRRKVFVPVFWVLIAALPVGAYVLTPAVLKSLDWNAVPARELAGRDNTLYYLRPWKQGDRGPEEFAMRSFAIAGDGIIIADFTPYMVLKYYRFHEGPSPGARLAFTEFANFNLKRYISDNCGKFAVFIVMKEIVEKLDPGGKLFSIEPAGPLYRVRLRD